MPDVHVLEQGEEAGEGDVEPEDHAEGHREPVAAVLRAVLG